MLASVAFTALSVFSTLEFAMSAIPINIAKFLDASISCNRIQEHLQLLDKGRSSSSGDDENINFKDTKLVWPSYGKRRNAFSLGPMDLSFPLGALRYVSSPPLSFQLRSDSNAAWCMERLELARA